MNHSTASIWCNSSLHWQQFPRWPITFSTFSTKEEEGLLNDSKHNTQTHFKNLWNLKTFTYTYIYIYIYMKVQKNIKLYFLSMNKDSTYSLKMWRCSLQFKKNILKTREITNIVWHGNNNYIIITVLWKQVWNILIICTTSITINQINSNCKYFHLTWNNKKNFFSWTNALPQQFKSNNTQHLTNADFPWDEGKCPCPNCYRKYRRSSSLVLGALWRAWPTRNANLCAYWQGAGTRTVPWNIIRLRHLRKL